MTYSYITHNLPEDMSLSLYVKLSDSSCCHINTRFLHSEVMLSRTEIAP